MRLAELWSGVARRTTLRRYLLGELCAEERARLEERYFKNDDLFEEMEMAEDELIDAYLRGHLSKSESRLFEENYLSSQRRRHKVGLARELLEYSANAEPPAPITLIATRFRFVQLAFLAGLVSFAGIVGWELITVHYRRRSRPPARSRPLASSESHVPQAELPAISLLLQSSRRGTTGSGSNLLAIPPGEHRIFLEVYPQDMLSTRFRAELFRRGRSVWREDVTPGAGQQLTLKLHSSDLPTGTYFLSVIGLADGAKPMTRERFGLEVVHLGEAP